MKKILLLFVLSVLVQYANAQIIAMHPDTTYLSTSGNVTVNGFATIVNFSADTLHLRWHRIVQMVQPAWVNAICDINACHSSADDFGDFEINPMDSGFVELILDPNNDIGDGLINIQIYDALDSMNINAFSSFIIHVDESTSINELRIFPQAKIYPNPVKRDATLNLNLTQSGNYTVQIIDMTERLVNTETVSLIQGENLIKLSVQNFAAGLYMVRVSDAVITFNMKLTVVK